MRVLPRRNPRLASFTASVLLFFSSDVAYAGRPLTIDDADPVEIKNIEIEAGGLFVQGSDSHWEAPIAVTFGLVTGLEVGLGLGGIFEERNEIIGADGSGNISSESGIGDLSLGSKWQFASGSDRLPRMALVPSVKFPTANDDNGMGSGKIDYDATWIASTHLSEKTGAHINVGYSWIGEPKDEPLGDVLHYGIAVDHLILDPLQCVGEIFAENEFAEGSESVVQGNTGFRWSAGEGLVFDFATGAGLSRSAPDFTVTGGLTWTFNLEA